jgi:3'-phosphoadenosine 5'-phosphosulfate sulfotransferase (PAPS reductase)/FAD synthetase
MEIDVRILSWFSCGAASAVATKLTIESGREVLPVYCETGAEHKDNERFLKDCENWFGVSIHRLKSDKFDDTWDVWEKRKYLAGIDGAPCTVELKIHPRLGFQKPDDIHVFGYTADKPDIVRANRLRLNYPEMRIETPLITAGLTKQSVIAMIDRAGIQPPPMYALGFQNNNCIPCVKATSASYWALVRKSFPNEFNRMVELSRRLDVRLARIGDNRIFIDEIPEDYPTTSPITPSCDFLCHLAEMGLGD